MAKTIAHHLVQALLRAGVQRMHGLTGDSLNGIIDEVRKTDGKMEFIHYRHEEAAAFAAGAEAQLTGKLAVCCGSCGPGNLHLINGLYDAHRSGAPVLAIASHIPSMEIGTGYFQETHPELIFQECSHYCEMISNEDQMPRVLQSAMQHAIGLGGVAVVVLPGDVAMRKVHDDFLTHDVYYPHTVLRPADADLDTLAGMLNGSSKVTVLAGRGCRGAEAEVMELCRKLGAPVVTALRGKDILEPENPYYVGLTGLIGFPSGNGAIMAADVLLCLGTDFPYKDWYPKGGVKIIQIDRDASRLGRRSRMDLGLCGDIGDTLQALLPRLQESGNKAHLERYRRDYEAFLEKNQPTVEHGATDMIHPQLVAKLLAEQAPAETVFTADVGTPTVWAARNMRFKKGQRLIGSFNHGSMASAMPQAIGALLARPHSQVVALCGDGGFAMLMGEILTIAQYNLPVKLVIFNNQALAFVETEMKVGGLQPFGIDLKNPDFAKLAEACGIRGLTVKQKEALPGAIADLLAQPGPMLLDVHVNPKELSFPPKIAVDQAWGFSLYMLKESAGGNPQEVWDTLKTNFLGL